MQLSWDIIDANAVAFSKRWKDAGDEKSEAQHFVRDFLAVFGIEDAAAVGRFEERALRESGRGFMDYFWPQKIAIEMKSRGKDLKEACTQLKDYVLHLPADVMPDLLMVSDFENIVIYRRTTGRRKQFKTRDLIKNVRQFASLAGYETIREIEEQIEVNVQAAERMARLHDALVSHGYEGHDLEVYLVRMLFCMFAEDTSIFPQDCFLNYVENAKEDGSNLSDRIGKLFEILNMPDEVRVKRNLISADLRQFRYIDGGLFKDMLPTAEFDAAMRRTLIDCCKFDWSKISPAIFGAMFQGIMNRDLRREIGAHYTSEGNILKLINPLFRDELWKEFERVKINEKQLDQFHDQIAKLKFLDPACGCGNFLMLAYRELRILELEILKMKIGRTRQKRLDVSLLLKVSVDQFYGIEIEDFPCEVARVGMWLVDHQMNLLVAEQFGQYYVRLPLTQSATIVHGNALRIDWESIVPKEYLSFIMGNPPYVGYSFQKTQQKEDILSVYLDANGKPLKTAGKIDYVAAWYYKASKMMVGTRIRTAFVSTNSITQGEQVAAVWKPLFELFDTHIDFAYQRFKWTNEAKGKAAVHCVIIGFSTEHDRDKVIYEGEEKVVAKNISPYLVAGPNILIESRKKPLCDVPEMSIGNRPADGGHLIIEGNEYAQFVEQEPGAKPYIRQLVGAEDYINNIKRYCLWLVDVAPSEIRKMPKIMERIQLCKLDRLNSRDEGRRKLADSPALFREAFNPEKFLLIPRVSSEKRRYIPFGFLDKNFIPHDTALMIPYATLYHFGVLTSSVHMAWMRQICGRLEIDYRYSKDIVYNNFPWPEATDAQKANIEILAQGVLDARAKFPGSSLADLYDPLTMPPELLKAHQALDHAVMKLYGFGKDATEAGIVAKLMVRYQELTG